MIPMDLKPLAAAQIAWGRKFFARSRSRALPARRMRDITQPFMRNYLGVIINTLTLGKENQSFLDAWWIQRLLGAAPAGYRRQMALTVLSWSPHYFFRKINPDYERLSHTDFTEREFERNRSTREKLCTSILLPYLEKDQVVLDYGCGPGFLAHNVSKHVRKVYGTDISQGVLACAEILHGSPSVAFVHTSRLDAVPDDSLDLAYSFAVIQHVSDSILRGILTTIFRKLKAGGRILIHVVLDASNWKTEDEWRSDTSALGRLRLKFALNCFKRSEYAVREIFESAGFQQIVVRRIDEMCSDNFDDVCTQHMVSALK